MTPPTPPQERFLDESVLADFTAMRMTAFGKSVIDIANDPTFDTWTFSQKVLYALDKEVAARRERRINKLLKASRSPNPDACLEDVVYAPDRNINPEQVSRLAHGQWCHLGQKHCHLGQILSRQDLSRPSTDHRSMPQRLLRQVLPHRHACRALRSDATRRPSPAQTHPRVDQRRRVSPRRLPHHPSRCHHRTPALQHSLRTRRQPINNRDLTVHPARLVQIHPGRRHRRIHPQPTHRRRRNHHPRRTKHETGN